MLGTRVSNYHILFEDQQYVYDVNTNKTDEPCIIVTLPHCEIVFINVNRAYWSDVNMWVTCSFII